MTEDVVRIIVPQFFCPCLLKILSCVSLRENKACTFFAYAKAKAFRLNQQALFTDYKVQPTILLALSCNECSR